jgi:hypothetical protein
VLVRIFLSLLLVTGLSGCDGQAVRPTTLPEDVAAVTTPFLAAVKRGDQAAAEKFVGKDFVDDSRAQFAEMSALLRKSPLLVPAVHLPLAIRSEPTELVKVIYAERSGTQWVTSELHLLRIGKGQFRVEYWDVKSTPQPPELLKHAMEMRQIMFWALAGTAAMALIGLALLIWLVKRRTHIIAPEPIVETRRVATTVRDGGASNSPT